jgi:hypothetical protein
MKNEFLEEHSKEITAFESRFGSPHKFIRKLLKQAWAKLAL